MFQIRVTSKLINNIIDINFYFTYIFLFNSGTEGLLEQATKWESSGEYAKAVDSFLKIAPSSSLDKETAIRCWMKVS